MSQADADFARGNDLLQSFVRGDAMIGLIADVPAAERQMLEAFWAAARGGSAEAFRALGDCYLATLRSLGAFDGVDASHAADHEWSAEAAAIEEDSNEELQAALRCYFEAGRLGDRDGTLQFARVSRHSSWDNQEIALKALKALPNPTPAETYQTGLVHHWVAELEEALACHLRAAEAGDGDAQFELSLFYAQGLGTDADEEKAREWLERAAEGGHPRALYNVGAAWASGSRGEPDMDRAAEYYDRAAAAGNGRAAAMIAVMILTEELVGTREQAVKRLEQADALGFPTWELLDAAGVDDPREDSDDSDEDDEDSDSDDEEDSDSDDE